MKNTIKILSVLIVVIFFVFIYQNFSSGSKTVTKEIWPLKIGNHWEISIISYDTLGNIKESVIDTIRVVRDSLWTKDSLNNKEKIYLINHSTQEPKDYVIYMVNHSDGLFLLNNRFKKNPQTAYKYLELNYKYPDVTGDIYFNPSNKIQIESVDTTITIKAGTFKCYKYVLYTHNSFQNEEIVAVYYFCPGIGIIQGQGFGKTRGGQKIIVGKMELVSYKVK